MNIPFQSANTAPVRLKEIPEYPLSDVIKISFNEYRLFSLFGVPDKDCVKLYFLLFNRENRKSGWVTSVVRQNDIYNSLSIDYPQFHLFERVLYEDFGIIPVNHPFLKPVRKNLDNYNFNKIRGAEVHEVAVGPVHAGVIEPGHFRFNCAGEKILSLEIMHGYQHKNVEELFMSGDFFSKRSLAESVCGDSAVAGAAAYAGVAEGLGLYCPDDNCSAGRALMLELERSAMHIGDMGAIAGDIAYISAADFFGAIRTIVINTSQSFSGNRFGRGFISPGNNRFPIGRKEAGVAVKNLKKVIGDIDAVSADFFSNPVVLSRLENICRVDKDEMKSLNVSGPSARSCGIDRDARFDYPQGFYHNTLINKKILTGGDLFSRAYLRYLEAKESLGEAIRILETFDLSIQADSKVFPLQENSICASVVESWRGELIHIGITGDEGRIVGYKIQDPSFCNWNALECAVRNNEISDFPVCNKSYNLSYCGFDL